MRRGWWKQATLKEPIAVVPVLPGEDGSHAFIENDLAVATQFFEFLRSNSERRCSLTLTLRERRALGSDKSMTGFEIERALTVVKPNSWEISVASGMSLGAYTMRAAKLFIMVSAFCGP